MGERHHDRVLYGLRQGGTSYRQQARLLGEAFAGIGVPVDYLLCGAGKPRLLTHEQLCERPGDAFGLYGAAGSAEARESAGGASALRVLRGTGGFDIGRYRAVFSESEPLSAWASRLQKVPSFGIGHALPDAAGNAPTGERASRWLNRQRLPIGHALSTHWCRTSRAVLPPLVDAGIERVRIAQDFTLAYLPEDELSRLVSLFSQLRSKHFIVYSPAVVRASQQQNVSLYPAADKGFRHHLERANRLVCHADPGLVAQALHVGLPLLVKPGEAARSGDADLLLAAGLARVSRSLGVLTLEEFVESSDERRPLAYPDVAAAIARHCLSGEGFDAEALAERLWSAVPERLQAA